MDCHQVGHHPHPGVLARQRELHGYVSKVTPRWSRRPRSPDVVGPACQCFHELERTDATPAPSSSASERRGPMRVRPKAVAWLSVVVLASGCSNPSMRVIVDRATTAPAIAVSSDASKAAAALTGPGPVEANATIVRAVDGDTVHVLLSDASGADARETVRLIGIDTPETHRPGTPIQCFGPEASRFTAALLAPGTPIRLERDVEARDRYGRLLAYIFRASDGVFVNLALARNGFAHAYTFPPNVAHTDEFVEAAGLARDEGLGLWSGCTP